MHDRFDIGSKTRWFILPYDGFGLQVRKQELLYYDNKKE